MAVCKYNQQLAVCDMQETPHHQLHNMIYLWLDNCICISEKLLLQM